MDNKSQLHDDMENLEIYYVESLKIIYATAKYRKLAKTKHPDCDGGNTVEFQILQGANAAGPLRKVWETIHK